MGNIMIVVVLLLLIGAAIVPTVKHFKGQGGCCGGGNYKPKTKKLDHVLEKKEFHINGMHCENCCNKVIEAFNDIPGVSAKVDLKKGTAIVSYEQKIDDSIIYEKIQKLGYTIEKG